MKSLRQKGDTLAFTEYMSLLDDIESVTKNLSFENAVSILDGQKEAWKHDFISNTMTPDNYLTMTLRRLKILTSYSNQVHNVEKVTQLLNEVQIEWTQLLRDKRVGAESVGKISEFVYEFFHIHPNTELVQLKK